MKNNIIFSITWSIATISIVFSCASTAFGDTLTASQLLLVPKIITQVPAPTTNQLYLKNFLQKLEKINKNNPNLSAIEEKIKKDVATNVDFTQQFIKKENLFKKPTQKLSFLSSITSFFESIFAPEEVNAGSGLPFGGPMVFTYPCTCSDAVMIFVGPTANPLNSDLLLGYVPGSQAFASYNIPLSPWLLGNYVPAAPICYMYIGYGCAPVTTEGTITPMVGSSPL